MLALTPLLGVSLLSPTTNTCQWIKTMSCPCLSRSRTWFQTKLQIEWSRYELAPWLIEKACLPRGGLYSCRTVQNYHRGWTLSRIFHIINNPYFLPLFVIDLFCPLSEIRDITIQHLPNHYANRRKPAWTLIQCLTLLHLAEAPLGSTKILLHTDCRTAEAQMWKSNTGSNFGARQVIFPRCLQCSTCS